MSKIRERAIGAGIAVAVAGGAFWGIAAANASSRAPADEPEAPGYVVVPREEPAPVVVPESARKPDPADAPPPADIPVEAPSVVEQPAPQPPAPPVDGTGDPIQTPPGNLDLGDPPPLPADPGMPGGGPTG